MFTKHYKLVLAGWERVRHCAIKGIRPSTGWAKNVTPYGFLLKFRPKVRIKFQPLEGYSYMRITTEVYQKRSNRTKVISLLVSPPTVFDGPESIQRDSKWKQAKNTFTRKSLKSQLLLWGQTDYAIRSPIYELSEFLLVFYSYNSAITHRNFLFQ